SSWVGLRRDQVHGWKIAAVSGGIPGQDRIAAHDRMRTDQEIRQDLLLAAAAGAVDPEGLGGSEGGWPREPLAQKLRFGQERVHLFRPVVPEGEFRVYDLVDDDVAT